MYAVKYGTPPLVRLLLSHPTTPTGSGPDLHVRSFINTTAIHWAVWPGHEAIVELLLKAGADPNDPMGDGSTPLHCAAASGLVEVAEVLVRWGCEVGRRNLEGKRAGEVAGEMGFPGMRGWLEGAEAEKGGRGGWGS